MREMLTQYREVKAMAVALAVGLAFTLSGLAQERPAPANEANQVGGGQRSSYPYPTARDFRGVAPPAVVWPSPPLGDGPFLLETAEQRIRVVVVTKGLSHPWSLAFLPDGAMLVTERE